MGWMLAVALLFVSGTQNQERTAPEPTILTASSSRTLGVPEIRIFDGATCDGTGHLFYRLTPTGASLNESVVMRLDLKSETTTVFGQPAKYNGTLWEYSLTPSGRLWFLDEVRGETGLHAVGFDSDGEVMTNTHLDSPPNLFVTSFSVSDDGSMLVGGFFMQEAESELRGKSYLGIFGRSGVLAKDAGSELPGQDLQAFAKGTYVHTPVTAGLDGNFYVLNNGVVLVMSEGGDIIRRLKVRRPEKATLAYAMVLSADLLSVEFFIPYDDGVMKPVFVVIDSSTGAPYGTYRASDDMGSCLCFSRQDGYTFSRTDKGKIQLLTTPLR
jgi:hypothetical protein